MGSQISGCGCRLQPGIVKCPPAIARWRAVVVWQPGQCVPYGDPHAAAARLDQAQYLCLLDRTRDVAAADAKIDADKKRQDPKLERRYLRFETKEDIEKPIGEWNEYEITCKGGDITFVVNGVKVNEGKN